MPSDQGKYWILTIPAHCYTPYLPSCVEYTKGQLEKGNQTGYLHWQILVSFQKKVSLFRVRQIYGDFNAELTRSSAADEYVWKEDTRVEGTQFELGKKKLKRNSPKDWDQIWQMAKSGDVENLPKDVLIRCYRNFKQIRVVRVLL
jgi:hypothetical protein